MAVGALSPVLGDRRAEQAREMLSQLARQLGPNSKLPSTRELRKSMGISQATLRAALDGMELRGFIRRRQGSGVYVSPAIKVSRIAVVLAHGVFETRSETYDHILFRALGPEATAHNCLLTYHFADLQHSEDKHGPKQLAGDAEHGRVDAMIIRGPLSAHAKEVQSLAIPSVFVTTSKTSKPRVENETNGLIVRGVQLLAEAGCRRIGFAFGSYPAGGDYPPAVKAFIAAVEAAGLQFNEQWLIPFPTESIASRPLQALTRFHRLWQDWPSRPDGLLSNDDQFTSGVVHACEILQLRIPEQLVIATHANKGLELFANAPVIRLEFDAAEVARAILATVDELLHPGQTVTEVRTIQPHVVMPPGR